MRLFNASEIANAVRERLGLEYPRAVFEASPIAIHKRVNQQVTGIGGRVVMAPSHAIGVGSPLFMGPSEAATVVDSYDFYCYGWDACSPSWDSQYSAAQALGDVVVRALWPYGARIKFTGGAPSGDQQSPATGAQLMLTFAVKRPVAGQLGPADGHDGGQTDFGEHKLDTITLNLEASE